MTTKAAARTPTDPATTMRADEKQRAEAAADIQPLLGRWSNARPDTDHIARLEVTERDGVVLVRPYGAASGELVDWGELPATPFVASGGATAAGFHAHCERGPVRTELAANVKQGILVIQSYRSFRDGSGRPSYFAREFFHHEPAEPAEPSEPPESPGAAARAPGSGRSAAAAGPAALVGRWVNSYLDTSWIRDFTITGENGVYALRVHGANEPAEWGEVGITTYQDSAGDPAFHAVYDLGPVEAVLAGNTGKGLIIIAAFLRSKSDGKLNFFCREFYYKVS